MANIFWNDKKAPRDEARKALMEYVAEIWLDRFTVNFDGYGFWNVLDLCVRENYI